MLNANLIEPMAFAASGLVQEWTFSLHELDERVAAHEYFADENVQIQAVFSGGTDKWQRYFIDVRLQAQLPLICQRCLKTMSFPLDETVRVLLFADEAAADAVDARLKVTGSVGRAAAPSMLSNKYAPAVVLVSWLLSVS